MWSAIGGADQETRKPVEVTAEMATLCGEEEGATIDRAERDVVQVSVG